MNLSILKMSLNQSKLGILILLFTSIFTSLRTLGQECRDTLEWIHPSPQGLDLTDVEFTDSLVGYVAGETILKTMDGGENWKLLDLPKSSYSIKVISRNNLFVVDYKLKEILLSNDGGKNWQFIKKLDEAILKIQILNVNTAFILTSKGLLKTDDGFNTLKSIPNIDTTQFKSFHFLDGNIGYAHTKNNLLWKTKDGGKNFSKVEIKLENESITSLNFLDTLIGFAITNGWWNIGRIHKTLDGGKTWTIMGRGDSFGRSYYFLNKDTGFATQARSKYNEVYRTTNGGNNWEVIQSSDTLSEKDNYNFNHFLPVKKFYFINKKIGWAVGHSGRILRTYDSGNTWSSNFVFHHSITNAVFLDNKIGYAAICGWGNFGSSQHSGMPDGGLYKTSDGGMTWKTIFDKCTNDVNFYNQEKGYFHSDLSNYNLTYDGGKTYLSLNKYGLLRCLEFVNNDIIFFSTHDYPSNKNSLWRSLDGGKSFSKVLIDSLKLVEVIKFINTKEGFYINNEGELFHTKDGGDNWGYVSKNHHPEINESRNNYRSLFFANPQVGFQTVLNDKHFYFGLKTIDGGATWTKMERKGYFVDAMKGLSIQNDSLWTTLDGGETWTLSPLILPDNHIKITSHSNYIFFGNTYRGIFKISLCPETFKEETTSNQVQTLTNENIQIFPNPSSGKITVKRSIEANQKTPFTLVNSLGRKVLEGVLDKNEEILNLETISPGIYILILNHKEQSIPYQILLMNK